eukprot:COSAG03_NODE_14835_length_450_cov_1.005698_1_plen_125_part_10
MSRLLLLPVLLLAVLAVLPMLREAAPRRQLQGVPPAPIPVPIAPPPAPLPLSGATAPPPPPPPVAPPPPATAVAVANGAGGLGKVAVLLIGQLRGYFQESEKKMHFLIAPLRRDFDQVRQLLPLS